MNPSYILPNVAETNNWILNVNMLLMSHGYVFFYSFLD